MCDLACLGRGWLRGLVACGLVGLGLVLAVEALASREPVCVALAGARGRLPSPGGAGRSG